MLMRHWLDKRAELTPDRLALIGDGEKITFRELRVRSLRSAGALAAFGVRKTDRVAILCGNGLHVPPLIHALPYLGAALVPLNTRLTVRELEYQVRDAGCAALVYDERFRPAAGELKRRLPGVIFVSTDELSAAQASAEAPILTEFDTEALHTIMYTSGTTGNPKGVLLSCDNHWASAIGSVLNLGLTERDRWLACVPLFHISGLSIIMRSVIYGMAVVIHEKFEPHAANRAILEEDVTIVSVVSNMLSRMVDALDGGQYPDTFRCMLLGGGPAPRPLLETCRDKGIPVFQTYGMTETASQIVTLPPEFMLAKLGSAGKPLFLSDLRIVRDGAAAPPNTEGEIEVRGPNVTKGYLNRPDATAEAFKDGWLSTGDIGYVDEDGFLYVLDRRKDLILSGGENVYPAEIESVLLGHPSVAEAGVTGMPDDVWGQVPVAFLRLRQEASVTEEEIRSFCAERLAKYKVPARVVTVVDALPRNASNKLLRRELHKLLSQE